MKNRMPLAVKSTFEVLESYGRYAWNNYFIQLVSGRSGNLLCVINEEAQYQARLVRLKIA